MTSTEQTVERTIERAPETSGRLDDKALDQLFREARSFSHWQDRPVEESVIQELYDLLRMGPTSANTSPARFVFVRSEEAKARLLPLMPEMNQEKTRRAPLVVMIAYDLRFCEKLGKLMPYRDIKPWFTENPAFLEQTARQSGTLQGAYLIMAVRPLGLDCGPMLGDNEKIEAEFFSDHAWRLNFVCAVGYGVREKLYPRLPRLDFGEAAVLL
jgi:3-hydroxypropanoate dehydrogenase